MNLDISELLLGGSSIAVGVLSCFFGARYFRPVIALTGFIIGLFTGIAIMSANSGISQVGIGGIALGVGIGLAFGFILYFLFDWSVIIAGAMLGLAVGFFFINLGIINVAPNSTLFFIILVACAIVGAAVGYGVRRLIIVLGTSFSGAMLIVYGLTIFIPSIGFVIRFRDVTASQTTWLASGMIAALGFLGFLVQTRVTGKNIKRRR